MKTNFNIILLLISLLLCNCKDYNQKELKTYSTSMDKFELKFRDTININEITSGSIHYNTKLDTLKQEEINKRYIFLHLKSQSTKRMDFSEIKSNNDWIYVDSLDLNGKFNFKILCDKVGHNTINLGIEDIIILKEKVNGKTRILTNEISIAKDVYVKPPSGPIMASTSIY